MTVSEHMHEDMADMIMDNFLSRVTDEAFKRTEKTLNMTEEEILGHIENEDISDVTHIRVMNVLSGHQVDLITKYTVKALAHMNGWDR